MADPDNGPEHARAVEPFRILGRLYYVGTRGVSSHLIDTGAGLVLIDAGFPHTSDLLLDSIRKLGYDPADVRLILNTHAHVDHIGGTARLAALSGADVCLGVADVPAVSARPELTECELYGLPPIPPFRVQKPLRDGDRVRVGELEVECLHTPGHTPGAMSFFFDVPGAGGVYRAGLHGGPGTATLRDAYLDAHGLPRALRAAYAESLRRLRALSVDVHLGAHPSQNDTFARKEKLERDPLSFVDSRNWIDYIDRLIRNFEQRFGRGEVQ